MNAAHGYHDRSTHRTLPNPADTFGLTTSIRTIVGYITITAAVIYYLLLYFDYPILPVHEMPWNCLVYMMPSRLMAALDQNFSNAETAPYTQGLSGVQSQVHAAKSAVMRRILGLGPRGYLTGFGRARSLSGIKMLPKKDRCNVPPGLGNWDNSCYQNSVIQGLASLRSFRDFLRPTTNHPGRAGPKLTRSALRDIIDGLNETSNVDRTLWTPAELKSMSSWQQQDAQEYFAKVVDEIDKELSKTVQNTIGGDGFSEVVELFGGQDDIKPGEDAANGTLIDRKFGGTHTSSGIGQKNHARNKPTTLLSHLPESPLEGLLAQRVGCLRCGYVEGLSLIPFNCLTVPLSKDCYQDVRDCLGAYTALEPIEGVECAKCTLLRSKEQLERLLHISSNVPGADEKNNRAEQSEVLRHSATARLAAVNEALEEEDFSDNTLTKKCQIPSRCRVSTTKSRQAVVARSPSSLVIHVNRSVFDEFSGEQKKNFATVTFPETMDIAPWSLGAQSSTDRDATPEQWNTDPHKSMLTLPDDHLVTPNQATKYALEAIITHYGRHENGHYICYRKHPSPPPTGAEANAEANASAEKWYRFSDDEVTAVTKQDVLDQGGVFMLFYEKLELPAFPTPESFPARAAEPTIETVTTGKPQLVTNESAACLDDETHAPETDGPPQAPEEQQPIAADSAASFKPPPMRTAGPQRKGGPRRRAGNVLAPASSMISAN